MLIPWSKSVLFPFCSMGYSFTSQSNNKNFFLCVFKEMPQQSNFQQKPKEKLEHKIFLQTVQIENRKKNLLNGRSQKKKQNQEFRKWVYHFLDIVRNNEGGCMWVGRKNCCQETYKTTMMTMTSCLFLINDLIL